MVTPPTTAGLTLTNIQLGSKSVAPDNAAYSDMCSYSLPITIQGALPSHMSIPSFVTTKTANPSVTITDRTTSTLIASTTDITLSFPTPTTFTLTTHFDFQNTTPPALAAVLSASRNGSPYSLAIAFSAVVTAHGFGIQLSSTTIDDTLVVPSGTAATPPAATVSDYTTVITALAITATSVAGDVLVTLPPSLPITATVPPLTLELLNPASASGNLLTMTTSAATFLNGVGVLAGQATPDDATPIAAYDDLSELAFVGTAATPGCFLADILAAATLTITETAPATNPATPTYKPLTPLLTTVELKSLANAAPTPTLSLNSLFSHGASQYLALSADVAASLPLADTYYAQYFSPAHPLTLTLADDAIAHVNDLQLDFDAATQAFTVAATTTQDVDISRDLNDLASVLAVTLTDGRMEKLFEKYKEKPKNEPRSGQSFASKMSLFLKSTPAAIHFDAVFDSPLNFPANAVADITTSTGAVLGTIDATNITLGSVQTFADVLAGYFSGTATTVMLGEKSSPGFFKGLELTLDNNFQDTDKATLTETRRLTDGTYEFEFPDWTGKNESYIRSLEILAMETFGTNDVAHEQFNTKLPTKTEISVMCMLGLCDTDTDIELQLDLPPFELDVFFDDAVNAAGTIQTDTLDWFSGASSSGELWLDSTLQVMNEQGGFIDKVLAIVKGEDDVTMNVKGGLTTESSTFLAQVLTKLSFNLNFDAKASTARKLATPPDLHPRSLAFLSRYNKDNNINDRKLNTYTGDEDLGLHTNLASTDTSMSLENTVFVWPHMYHMPFDLRVGEMTVVASLTGVDEAPTILTMAPFHMKTNVGGIIDTTLHFEESNKKALRSVIKSFWNDPSSEAEFDFTGTMESSEGTKPVAFDFLQPHISGKVNGMFQATASAGRRMLEEQKGGAREQIMLSFFGGGRLGMDAMLPCIVPQLCEDNLYSDKFGSQVLNVLVTFLDFPLPSWLFWVLDIPDVTVEIREDLTRLVAATVKGRSFDNNNQDDLAVSAAAVMVNPAHLYETIKPIVEPNRWGHLPLPKYSIQPAKDFNFLSFVLSGIFVEIDMNAKKKSPWRRNLGVDLSDWGGTVCEGQDFPISDMNNFFSPTKCQGTFDVVGSTADESVINFQLMHPPVPVKLVMPSFEVAVMYKGKMIYSMSTPNLVLGSSMCTTDGVCPPQDVVFRLHASDEIGEFNGRIMEEAIRAVSATEPDPLALSIEMSFDTQCVPDPENKHPWECTIQDVPLDLGGQIVRQKILMEMMLFEQLAAASVPTPSEDGAVVVTETCSDPLFKGECCNECVNDYSKLYSDFKVDVSSSISNSAAFWNGFDLIFEMELCNILAFDLYVADLTVSVDYDDMDGVPGWWSEVAYEPAQGISLVSEMTHNFENGGFRMESGKCGKTSQFKVTVSDGLAEHLRRIYDEAYTKGRLCMEITGSVSIGMKAPGGELFKWNQPLHIPTTNILDPSNNVCSVDRSECQVSLGYIMDMWPGEKVGTKADWIVGNGAAMNDDATTITFEGDGFPVAWYKPTFDALRDWQIGFSVAHATTSTMGYRGKGLCFVIQGADEGLGAMSTLDTGYGYASIGKSAAVCFDVEDNKAHVFQNGDCRSRDGEVDPTVNNLGGEVNAEVVVKYEAQTRVLWVYYTPSGKEGTTLFSKRLDLVNFVDGGWKNAGPGDSAMRLGFTAEPESGWSGASKFIVYDAYMSVARYDPAQCTIDEQGLTKSLRGGELKVITRTSCGTPLNGGSGVLGDVFFMHKDYDKKGKAGYQKSFGQGNWVDQEDGTYKATYGDVCDGLTGEQCKDWEGMYWVFMGNGNLGHVSLITGGGDR